MFEQVAAEAAQAVGAHAASLARFEEDGRVTFVGGWSETGALAFPVGSRLPVEETGVLAAVRATGEPQRIDRYEGLAGAVIERFTSFGYGSAVAAPIKLGGQVWGALVAAGLRGIPFAVGSERQLTDFTALVAQALANAEAYTELASSRARIVEAADTERRRLERNLHDGAQQRLVSLALQLQLVGASLRRDPEATEQLVQIAADDLKQALAELRELARGIHPAILSDRGLAAALRALVERAPVPVTLTRIPDARLPDAIEAAIYYVVAEAITNVAKYAHATHANVAVERSHGIATVVISDDGVGGAKPGAGSGLVGLTDRVEALSGRLRLESTPGRGTHLSAQIPCD